MWLVLLFVGQLLGVVVLTLSGYNDPTSYSTTTTLTVVVVWGRLFLFWKSQAKDLNYNNYDSGSYIKLMPICYLPIYIMNLTTISWTQWYLPLNWASNKYFHCTKIALGGRP